MSNIGCCDVTGVYGNRFCLHFRVLECVLFILQARSANAQLQQDAADTQQRLQDQLRTTETQLELVAAEVSARYLKLLYCNNFSFSFFSPSSSGIPLLFAMTVMVVVDG